MKSLESTQMIDNSTAEVFPCRCNPEDCDYKRQWVGAGSPTLVPYDVVTGKKHVSLVSEWLKATYCNRKGETFLFSF